MSILLIAKTRAQPNLTLLMFSKLDSLLKLGNFSNIFNIGITLSLKALDHHKGFIVDVALI